MSEQPDTRPSFEELMYQYRPLLNVSELERQAELPRNTISGCFGPAGLTGRKINSKHYARILWEIARVFGAFKIGETVYESSYGLIAYIPYDEDSGTFTASHFPNEQIQNLFRP